MIYQLGKVSKTLSQLGGGPHALALEGEIKKDINTYGVRLYCPQSGPRSVVKEGSLVTITTSPPSGTFPKNSPDKWLIDTPNGVEIRLFDDFDDDDKEQSPSAIIRAKVEFSPDGNSYLKIEAASDDPEKSIGTDEGIRLARKICQSLNNPGLVWADCLRVTTLPADYEGNWRHTYLMARTILNESVPTEKRAEYLAGLCEMCPVLGDFVIRELLRDLKVETDEELHIRDELHLSHPVIRILETLPPKRVFRLLPGETLLEVFFQGLKEGALTTHPLFSRLEALPTTNVLNLLRGELEQLSPDWLTRYLIEAEKEVAITETKDRLQHILGGRVWLGSIIAVWAIKELSGAPQLSQHNKELLELLATAIHHFVTEPVFVGSYFLDLFFRGKQLKEKDVEQLTQALERARAGKPSVLPEEGAE